MPQNLLRKLFWKINLIKMMKILICAESHIKGLKTFKNKFFQGRYWPLLPWIVMEFIRLFAKVVFLIMVLIVWAIYVGENADYSHIIATGVIGAGATGEYTLSLFYF